MKLYQVVATALLIAILAVLYLATEGSSSPTPSTPSGYDDAAMKELKL